MPPSTGRPERTAGDPFASHRKDTGHDATPASTLFPGHGTREGAARRRRLEHPQPGAGRLIKELWAFHENRIAVRFAYEWHDDSGSWFRSYGNENWEFDGDGLMRHRHACINDAPSEAADRRFFWPLGRRPDDHPGLSDFGF